MFVKTLCFLALVVMAYGLPHYRDGNIDQGFGRYPNQGGFAPDAGFGNGHGQGGLPSQGGFAHDAGFGNGHGQGGLPSQGGFAPDAGFGNDHGHGGFPSQGPSGFQLRKPQHGYQQHGY